MILDMSGLKRHYKLEYLRAFDEAKPKVDAQLDMAEKDLTLRRISVCKMVGIYRKK